MSEKTVLRSARWEADLLRSALKEPGGNGGCQLQALRGCWLREVASLRERGEHAAPVRRDEGCAVGWRREESGKQPPCIHG